MITAAADYAPTAAAGWEIALAVVGALALIAALLWIVGRGAE